VICRSFIFVSVAVVIIWYSSSATRTRASTRARSIFPRHVFLRSFTVTRLSANYRAKALIPTESEKNHKKGGLNCVFKKTFLSYVLKNCSQIQSLT